MIAATTIMITMGLGTQPAWADYDGPSCRISAGRLDTPTAYQCETAAIIPHNSELWVRVHLMACGAGMTRAVLRNLTSGEIVGGPYTLTGRVDQWDNPLCNWSDRTVYGMQYRNYYRLEAELAYHSGPFVGRVRICNFTYDPSDGRTC
ncbi:hypothetical protein ACQEVF_56865 [Nonomuraea polychroma]|uniref:hypothetical protein n=1 Tax=Nonomuraea polychroma TaxID=46176 RepID=UPI003D946A06